MFLRTLGMGISPLPSMKRSKLTELAKQEVSLSLVNPRKKFVSQSEEKRKGFDGDVTSLLKEDQSFLPHYKKKIKVLYLITKRRPKFLRFTVGI